MKQITVAKQRPESLLAEVDQQMLFPAMGDFIGGPKEGLWVQCHIPTVLLGRKQFCMNFIVVLLSPLM